MANPNRCRKCKINFAAPDGWCGRCRPDPVNTSGPIRRDNFMPGYGKGFGGPQHKGPFPDKFGADKKKFGIEREGYGR